MSTMLKTAAMGLLSKTLQTFLHKYLLEVDVEGVAMPSLMDVDGHSGWGVRLCNVKLREGVELMTLPGKRKVKKKRRRKKTAEPSKDEEPNRKPAAASRQDQQPQRHGDNDQYGENGFDAELSNIASMTTPTRSRMMTEDDTDMESVLSSRVPSPSIVCRTSVTGAITGCLTRGGNTREATTDDEEEVDTPSAPPSRGVPSELRDSIVKHNVVFDTEVLEGRRDVSPKELFQPVDSATENGDNTDKSANEVHVETVPDEKDEGNEKVEDNSDGEEDEEEEYLFEEDMILCLGKGGTIGTLDVRLVGKELHVMVEDAFLTVEACPKLEEVDEDASMGTAATADTTKEDATKAKKKEKKKPPAAAKKKEGETVGERVMENSALARAISAIPHLLLRDVTIQLIVRNKAHETEGGVRAEVNPEDAVLQVGIEMISVSSGDDFLENFRNEEDAGEDMEGSTSSFSSRNRVSLRELEERDENEYLTKRIRTGKGPEGGITVKVYPPRQTRRIASRVEEQPDWAIQSFTSSAQFCLLRCSGLDIQTRIFLGKQKEVAIRTNAYAWYGDEYDEYTIDSMLFGVDYIAPAPPPLPPLKTRESFAVEKKLKPEVERFVMDENGIQSNKVRSCFHKVARGLTPTLCQKNHLPSEHCPYCWENSARPNSYSEHPLDSRTPLPGIIFNVALTEPLELNVDRQSLDVIGSIQELFVGETEPPEKTDVEDTNEDKKPETSSIAQKLKDMSKNFRMAEKKETLKASFPSYMKPETIEVVGVYVSQIILRVHALKGEGIFDQGLGFRYWEASLRCITVDLQQHTSKEKQFQDIRCGLGHLEVNDHYGVEKLELLTVGLEVPDGYESDTSVSLSSTMSAKKLRDKAPWPTTAAFLLQIPPLSEASEYESRERHGVQLRFFSLGTEDSDLARTTLNSRVGVVDVKIPAALPGDIITCIDEVNASIFGPPVEVMSDRAVEAPTPPDKSIPPSLMKYAVRLDGGRVNYSQLVEARLPVLKVAGEVSSDSEVFLETVLNHVKVQYGKRSMLESPRSEFSLTHMARLPEDVRMRILLCLKDLGPMEKALGVKKGSNSFMRCRAVNKAIAKVAKRSSTRTAKRKKSSSRSDSKLDRQDILNELMKLDEQALAEVWATHKSRSRAKGLTKKRSTSNAGK